MCNNVLAWTELWIMPVSKGWVRHILWYRSYLPAGVLTGVFCHLPGSWRGR
jgi:hypothetical protein